MIKIRLKKVLLLALAVCMMLTAAFAAIFMIQPKAAKAASDPVLTDTEYNILLGWGYQFQTYATVSGIDVTICVSENGVLKTSTTGVQSYSGNFGFTYNGQPYVVVKVPRGMPGVRQTNSFRVGTDNATPKDAPYDGVHTGCVAFAYPKKGNIYKDSNGFPYIETYGHETSNISIQPTRVYLLKTGPRAYAQSDGRPSTGAGNEPLYQQVAKPTGQNHTYDGGTKYGVSNGTGYTLSGTTYATNAGIYYATATLQSGYIWSDGTNAPATIMWIIDRAALDYNHVKVTQNATYTGDEVRPVFSVTVNGKVLQEGTDFTYDAVTENIEAGTGYFKIYGKGNYSGNSGNVPFTIDPKNMSSASVSVGSATYNGGSAVPPTVTITDDGKTLTPGVDYDVKFTNNTNAGTAQAIIAYKGNYTGGKTVNFTIQPQSITPSVAVNGSFTYTGGKIEPKPTVTYNGKTLQEGVDYTLSYSNNTAAGPATVIVTGKGNYSFTASQNFTIGKADQSFSVNAGTLGCVTNSALTTGKLTDLISGTHSSNLQFTSSDPSVIRINDDGTYTVVGQGSATISVTSTGDSNYNAVTTPVTGTITTQLKDGFYIGSLNGENQVFASLQDAIDAAKDGETVYAKGNPVVNGGATLNTNKTITIAGHKEADGTVGTIVRGNGCTGSVITVSNGSLTLENVTLDGKNISGSSLVTVGGGSLIVKDGTTLTGGNAQNGGAISVSGGNVTISGGEFENNGESGERIVLYSTTVTI